VKKWAPNFCSYRMCRDVQGVGAFMLAGLGGDKKAIRAILARWFTKDRWTNLFGRLMGMQFDRTNKTHQKGKEEYLGPKSHERSSYILA